MVTATSKITLGRVIFILAGIAVIVSQPGGYDFALAMALAFVLASTCVLLLARSYMRRERALRFGGLATTAILIPSWLALFGASFFFLYYPESVWRWS
jgi:drug/metabolite transporter (DMT)-like permease